VLRTPNATNLGRLTGSIEFQGETNTDTAIEVKVTYVLSNLVVDEVSTSKEYLITPNKGQNPAPSEEGTGLWF
jgi:hypothetical protein